MRRPAQPALAGRRRALVLLAPLPLLAAGCATTSPLDVSMTPDAAARLSRWSGRFAVTLTEPGAEIREERASGRFLLHQAAGSTELELLSPLGQTIATAVLDNARASLATAEGERFEADSAEALTERVFGWRIPIGNLPDWLRGRVAGASRTAGGIVEGIEHDWAIRLDGWRDAGPGRLDLDWPAVPRAGVRRVKLRLIVDQAS